MLRLSRTNRVTLNLREAFANSGGGALSSVRDLADDFEFAPPVSVRELMAFTESNAEGRRPFYLIAHRCNDLDKLRKMVRLGANAIECDIRPSSRSGEFVVNHDVSIFPQRDALGPYLDGLVAILRANPQVALIMFDCKDGTMDSARLRQLVRSRLTEVVAVNVLFSVSAFTDRNFFLPLVVDMRPREGYAIDQDDDPERVERFFADIGIPRQAFGDGIAVPAPKPSLHRIILRAVAQKWSRRRFRMVYTWTLADKDSMRNYLRMGVDGIFVNDVAELASILREPVFATSIRLAGRAEDPFVPLPRHAYVISAVTGTRQGAGTDAHITVELQGNRGQMTATLNSRPAGLFEAGHVNDFAVIGRHVGRLQQITVSVDDAGLGEAWFVESLAIQATGSQRRHTFSVHRWIEPDSPLRLNVA